MLRNPPKKDGINHFLPNFVGLGDISKLENEAFKEIGINAKKYNIYLAPSLYLILSSSTPC